MPVRTALFADPDRTYCWRLKTLAQNSGIVAEVCMSAEEARRALVTSSPMLFFSNLRLGSVKGPDLVHLARMANPRTRAVLYGTNSDLVLVKMAQEAGAFFEPAAFLPYSLKQYFAPTLPPRDRRDASRTDRRQRFRGGRRATDVERLHVLTYAERA
jgi:DNA-binding NtrC family response regulator